MPPPRPPSPPPRFQIACHPIAPRRRRSRAPHLRAPASATSFTRPCMSTLQPTPHTTPSAPHPTCAAASPPRALTTRVALRAVALAEAYGPGRAVRSRLHLRFQVALLSPTAAGSETPPSSFLSFSDPLTGDYAAAGPRGCGASRFPVDHEINSKSTLQSVSPAQAAARGYIFAPSTRSTVVCQQAHAVKPPRFSRAAAAAAPIQGAEKAAYDAPVQAHAEGAGNKMSTMLSSPPRNEAGQERRGSEASASRKWTMRSVAMEEAMAVLSSRGSRQVPGGHVREAPLAGRRLQGEEQRREEDAEEEQAAAMSASRPATPLGAEEIDVSYPSIASSSEVSFPAILGVSCILDASDRTSRISLARGQRLQRTYNSTGSSERSWSRKVTRVTSQHPFNLRTEGQSYME